MGSGVSKTLLANDITLAVLTQQRITMAKAGRVAQLLRASGNKKCISQMEVAKRLIVSCHAFLALWQAINETLTVGTRESQVKLARKEQAARYMPDWFHTSACFTRMQQSRLRRDLQWRCGNP